MWVAWIVRFVRAGLSGLAILLCANSVVFAQARSPAPADRSPEPGYCAVGVRAQTLKGHNDEVVLSLWADDNPARATGTIAVYQGNTRYSIPFTGAIAADQRNTSVLPTPIVVHFDSAAKVDSGYVAALDGTPCLIHNPFVRNGLEMYHPMYGPPLRTRIYPDWTKAWNAFLELAALAPPVSPSASETVDAPACAKPYVMAYTAHAFAPETPPENFFSGPVAIKLAVGTDGGLLALRVELSSRFPRYDAAAVDAVERSRFAPEIYRCAPVTGDYIFYVVFQRY